MNLISKSDLQTLLEREIENGADVMKPGLKLALDILKYTHVVRTAGQQMTKEIEELTPEEIAIAKKARSEAVKKWRKENPERARAISLRYYYRRAIRESIEREESGGD